MHSYEGPSGRIYHHTSHGSVNGVVRFDVPYQEMHVKGWVARSLEVVIPMGDILSLAADLVRTQRVSDLENATDLDILGLT